MGLVPFDTLELARRLKADGGFTSEHAEGTARALADALSVTVATKMDLLDLEQRLTIKLGAMMAASIAAVAALVRLL
jgi:hypothetical protein